MIKVRPLQEKTWNDKTFWEVEANHEGVAVKASIWPPFPTQFVVGQEVEINGTLSQNAKGYWSIKTNPMGSRPGWAGKENQVKAAQERKEKSIDKFADRKETNILLSSVQRDATLLTTTRLAGQPTTRSAMAEEWLYWKKWLLENRPTEELLEEVEINNILK